MISLEEIARIEAAGKPGDGTPGRVYSLLKQRWQEGARDRETGLSLMFWAWVACAEFNNAGFEDGWETTSALFREVFQYLGGESSNDPEVLFAAGYWASFQPECIGDSVEWRELGERCLEKSKALRAEGFDENDFEGRGSYGKFFAMISPTNMNT